MINGFATLMSYGRPTYQNISRKRRPLKRLAAKKCRQKKLDFCYSLARLEDMSGNNQGATDIFTKACKDGLEAACSTLKSRVTIIR